MSSPTQGAWECRHGVDGRDHCEACHDTQHADDVRVPRDLLESLVSEEDCWFDHHGGCQAHGYLSLEPDEVCPQEQAKQILRGGQSNGGK